MEEQDIREIWKSDDSTGEFNYSGQTIERILEQGPQNVVSRFVKTLKFEQHLNWIAFTLLMCFLFYEGLWTWALVILGLNVGFFFYYRVLIKKLDRGYVDNEVIRYLHEIHRIIQRFILHYKFVGILVGLLVAVLVIYASEPEAFMDRVYDPKSLLTMAIAFVFATALVFYLTYLMYGKKANSIKEMIRSLDSEEA